MTTRGRNPDYLITLSQPTQGLFVVADMPEETAYAVASHYDSNSGSVADALGAVGQGLQQFSGTNFIYQPQTHRTWTGTSYVSFTLRLLFDALYNSQREVHDICTQLASMALPGQSGLSDFLSAPNPSKLNNGTNQIDIRIGRMCYWTDMIVEAANVVEESRLEDTGFPIAGAIDCHISSDYVYSKEMLFAATGYGSAGGNFFDNASSNLDRLNQLRGNQ